MITNFILDEEIVEYSLVERLRTKKMVYLIGRPHTGFLEFSMVHLGQSVK